MTATETVEETVEALERIPTAHLNGTTKKQQIIILSAVGLGGLVVGFFAGNWATKKALGSKFERVLEEEIEKSKGFYRQLYKTDESGRPLTPQETFGNEASKPAVDAVLEYQGRDNEHTDISVEAPSDIERHLMLTDDGESNQAADEVEQHNIFEDYEGEPIHTWNLEEEKLSRTSEHPYIISHEEFYEAEQEFEQDELRYFVEDDVLCDSQGIPVTDVEGNVGGANLEKFGHGSDYHNKLYIRNEQRQIDFEITRHTGKYTDEVLGYSDTEETELRHSRQYRAGKMRASDE